jgi:hypothetical protein
VVLLVYNTLDVESLRYLEEVYDNLPRPPEYRDIYMESDCHIRNPKRYLVASRRRIIRSKAFGTEHVSFSKRRNAYVAMDHYPVVVASYSLTFEDNDNSLVYYDDFNNNKIAD